MKPVFFKNSAEFRSWLEKNHQTANEIFVGYHKVHTGKPSMTWSESVDQALCFGWIDGIRRSIDDESYHIRFTPRKSGSNWSEVNIKKIAELTKAGLMRPAGIAAYEKKKEDRSGIYSYESKGSHALSAAEEKMFRANTKAWNFFESTPPSYRKPAINWVVTAKQESTRIRRMEQLIEDSFNQKRLKHLSYVSAAKTKAMAATKKETSAKKAAKAATAATSGAPVKVYHNVRCSKSRDVCSILEKKKIKTEIVEYLKQPPTQTVLKQLLKMLGMKASEIVRTNEPLYKEQFNGRKLTEAQWIKALVENPILIERPIIVKGDKAIIGRPPEKVLDFLKD